MAIITPGGSSLPGRSPLPISNLKKSGWRWQLIRPGISVMPRRSTASAATPAWGLTDAIRLPSSVTSWTPGSMLRPSKIRAFASTFMVSSCISSLRRPAAAAEAPLRREPLVVVAHGAAQALVEGLTVELEGRGVGLHLAAHRLEPPGEDAPHVLALLLLEDLEEHLLREDGVGRSENVVSGKGVSVWFD